MMHLHVKCCIDSCDVHMYRQRRYEADKLLSHVLFPISLHVPYTRKFLWSKTFMDHFLSIKFSRIKFCTSAYHASIISQIFCIIKTIPICGLNHYEHIEYITVVTTQFFLGSKRVAMVMYSINNRAPRTVSYYL